VPCPAALDSAAVTRVLLERKLSSATTRLRELREELAVAEEQLAALVETADDARLRALVSETPLAGREHEEAQRHADAMHHHRAGLVRLIDELERSQDELLDRLVAEIA
jgi:predicted  nucleic acid-binding Zn-ribbon protein